MQPIDEAAGRRVPAFGRPQRQGMVDHPELQLRDDVGGIFCLGGLSFNHCVPLSHSESPNTVWLPTSFKTAELAMTKDREVNPPSATLLALEGRGLFDMASLATAAPFLTLRAPWDPSCRDRP